MTRTRRDHPTIERPDWLTEQAWPYTIRSVAVGDDTIAYTDEGEGPALLLVHAGMWSFVWGQLIGSLHGDHRVVTLDFPGSGLSPAGAHGPSIAGDARILEAFVDELGLDELTLVAHDLGGPVGLGMAMQRPGMIRGLVLINTFAWVPESAGLRAMLASVSSAPITAVDVATNIVPRLTSGRFGVGRHLDSEGRAAFLGPFRARGPRRRFHDMMGTPLREGEYLAAIEGALRTTLADRPVLTVYGERNDPFGFQARFKTLFPDATELVIPRGNHFPMADDPVLVAAAISDWHSATPGD